MKEGIMITVDGADGTGKSTNIKEIACFLTKQKIDYVLVQDPSSEVAGQIRDMLLNTENLENSTRLYLYLAARSELLNKQIIPALKAGKVVICDRYALSTYCYQGEFFTKEQIDLASQIGGLDAVKPKLQIVYLSEQSFREKSQEDVMGIYCNEYRKGIIKRYLELAENPDLNIKVIWTDRNNKEKVVEETLKVIKNYL